MSFMTETIKQELISLYESPGRFYHSINHVNALLELLDRYRDKFADPSTVEAAIWFHDCIYDPRGQDNEHQSAELAFARLEPMCNLESDRKRLRVVCDMIEATATHAVPPGLDLSVVSDTVLFLDMDLSILGSDREQFEEYEAAVRREYSWVSDDAWRKGRADVLARFQARPRIFSSELFHNEYEVKARDNITSSLKKLRSSDCGTDNVT